uniref:Uncharacterized protein LOC100176074 n=1 Tax=Phallusia mammillata TaxID=59560 RepID=A0A6F9DH95_9ASCI|nr:uncharacterized protein LOC100176074 [Phallusia mammillata]
MYNIYFFVFSQKLKKMSLRSQTHTTPGGSQAGEAIGLDYDTYLRNRRPGSKTPSGAAHTQPMTPKQLDANKTDNKESLILKDFPTSLHINLAKLEQNALRSFDNSPDEGITIHVHHETGLPAKSLFSKPLTVTFLQDEQRDSPQKFSAPVSTPATAPSKKREPVTVQQMLGPTKALVRPGLNQPHPVLGTLIEGGRDKQMREVAVQCQPDVEVPNHEWRIHDKAFEIGGGKPTLAEIEPTQEHLIMNREAGRDIREAIEYWHEQEYSKPRPQAKKHNPSPRLRDNVSLATLMAVSKAYRDRDKNDLISMKVDRVMRIQQERMQAKHIVTAYKEEKRSTAMSQRQEDRLRIAEALQQQEINKNAYVEYAQERKERALQRHRTRHAELMFASDFGNQHTSVSNALIRHDRQAAKEDVKADKEDIVSGVKMQLSEQAELVRRYMEHKQISRQMKSGQEKSKFDTQILQETNDRLLAAKQRVAGIKARKAAVQAFHHSLPATANASSWPVVVSRNHPQQNDPDNPNHDALPKVKTSTAPVLRIHEADHVNDTLELPPVPPFPSASGDMVSPRQLSNVSSTLAVQS